MPKARSADSNVTNCGDDAGSTDILQPFPRDAEHGRIASEVTPLISAGPVIAETEELNPALPGRSSPISKSKSVDVDVASISSSHSDKDWVSHVGQLPLWASPICRMCVLLALVGIGITVAQPSMEVIYYKLACQSLGQNCTPKLTQELVSKYVMWDSVIDSAVSLTVCTKVTSMSDIHGRKPFLTAFVVMVCVSFYIKYFLMSRSSGFPMWGLWASTAVGSCAGGVSAFLALFKAYVTDITVAHERVNAISYCVVSFTVGQVLGPLVSSFLLNSAKRAPQTDNQVPELELLPLRASLLVFTVASLFSFVLLLESRSHKSRMKSRSASVVSLQAPRPHLPTLWSKIGHYVSSFVEPLWLLTFPQELRTEENAFRFKAIKKCVILLSATELLLSTSILVTQIIEPQYTIYKFHWDSVAISNFSIARSMCVIFSLSVFLPLLYKHVFPRFKSLRPQANTLDAADAMVMATGLCVYACDHFAKAVAKNGSIFVALSMVGAFAGVVGPVAAAAPVKFFPSSKVGEFYGAMALAQGIVTLFSPMIFTRVYTFGVNHDFPGAPYIFTSTVFFILFACIIAARRAVRGVPAEAVGAGEV
ncbi:hypothetical protein ACI3L0_004616 [Candidozyma auris]|uniref:Major facilitator superfamily (MFS) profile domain-containing protein n=1 Tax=Candidozyma auris TaxID=498019 RepID=A0A2H0ZEE4_CANAR|nr:hypothetical protein B9J08_005323 [[Candida] auris]